MQRPYPICVICRTVITDWSGRGNRPIFCSDPIKKCRLNAALLPNPLCARPGCLQPFERTYNENGKLLSAIRFCPPHRDSGPTEDPTLFKRCCQWCGKPVASHKPMVDRNSQYDIRIVSDGTTKPHMQRQADYCSIDCKLSFWTYPGQYIPMCRICHEEIKPPTWNKDKNRFSPQGEPWKAVNNPGNSHAYCTDKLLNDERSAHLMLVHPDERIREFCRKIVVPTMMDEYNQTPAQQASMLKYLGLTLVDVTATAKELKTVQENYQAWQKETFKIDRQR